MNAVNQSPGPCPCGVPACDAFGTKIAAKTGHLKGCTCLPCQGSANRKTGRAAHKRMHRALGGVGDPPEHEGRARPYRVMVEVSLLPESKAEGEHVPESFHDFIGGKFLRGAMQQSAREVPVGSGVVPSVVIDGRWLIADLGDGSKAHR